MDDGDDTRQARQEVRAQVLQRVRDEIWRMHRTGDIENVLATMREGLLALGVPFHYCSVNLVDERDDTVSVRAHSISAEGQEGRRRVTGLEAAVVSRIWNGREPVYRADLEREDPYDERAHLKVPLRSLVDVPFSHGTLAVSSPEPNAFSADDLGDLQAMAHVLSEGYRRLDDLRAVERRVQESETLARAIEVVSDSHEVDDVLAAVVRAATDLMTCERAVLFLYDEEEGALVPQVSVGHDWEVYRHIRL